MCRISTKGFVCRYYEAKRLFWCYGGRFIDQLESCILSVYFFWGRGRRWGCEVFLGDYGGFTWSVGGSVFRGIFLPQHRAVGQLDNWIIVLDCWVFCVRVAVYLTRCSDHSLAGCCVSLHYVRPWEQYSFFEEQQRARFGFMTGLLIVSTISHVCDLCRAFGAFLFMAELNKPDCFIGFCDFMRGHVLRGFYVAL